LLVEAPVHQVTAMLAEVAQVVLFLVQVFQLLQEVQFHLLWVLEELMCQIHRQERQERLEETVLLVQ
jgi:hypothetical protein